jgi:hypothetical protein
VLCFIFPRFGGIIALRGEGGGDIIVIIVERKRRETSSTTTAETSSRRCGASGAKQRVAIFRSAT